MKKALIAAAVASALAAPSAMAADLSVNLEWGQALRFGESTVTNAGVDTTTDIQEVADAGRNRIKWNWTETLDNGIGVHAYLVFGNLNTAGGNPDFSDNTVSIRNANIGFSGDFGTVQVGTNEHFYEVDLIIDPLAADYLGTGDALAFMSLGRSGFNFLRRDGESVEYTSTDMNGFKARAAYIMGPQNATADADQDGMIVGLSYASGPLFVGVNQATYNDYAVDGGVGAPIAGTEAQSTSFKVSYDMGVAKITAAMWDTEQSGLAGQGITNAGGVAVTDLEVSATGIDITMPLAGGAAWVGMSSSGDQDATTAAGSQAITDSGKDGWHVGYLHNMSAQTYMFVRYGSQETGLNFDATAGSTEQNEMLLGWLLNY